MPKNNLSLIVPQKELMQEDYSLILKTLQEAKAIDKDSGLRYDMLYKSILNHKGISDRNFYQYLKILEAEYFIFRFFINESRDDDSKIFITGKGILELKSEANSIKLQPSQKLDEVLNFLSNKGYTTPQVTQFEIWETFLNKGIKLNFNELRTILDKLIRENYIEIYEEHESNIIRATSYFINFDGRALLEMEGGYSGRLRQNKKQEEDIQNVQKSTLLLTRVVAIGTTVAAICYIMEILKIYNLI